MAFIGRREHLERLEHWWTSSERFALVWGRRRVGKTALIREFAKTRRTVIHTGGGESERDELATLSRRSADTFATDIRDLVSQPYRDWHDALDHLARLARDEPALLVLDEFPELLTGSPALPGILRAFWDNVQGETKLRVLLCGSSVRTMFSIQETRAPLYGRFDLTLPVYPFRPREAAAMLPNLTPADRAAVYGLVGGMPLYLSWWDQGASVAENLMELACQPGARLLTEGRLVLATEAGDGDQPSAVLRAIATGKTKFNEIADVTGTNPTRTLDRLKELRLVERLLPVTESPKSRRRIYRICDNFLAFYLGPLMRYRGEIELGIGQSILPSLVASLDDHFGLAYEEAFREHLRDLAVTGELGPGVVAVGSWWRDDGDSQIDGVVLAERGRTRTPILVGECKWTRSVNATRLRNRLYEKAAQLTDKRDELSYAVCAREEVTHVQDETLTITADDIFAP
jgi:uncharacterized protein